MPDNQDPLSNSQMVRAAVGKILSGDVPARTYWQILGVALGPQIIGELGEHASGLASGILQEVGRHLFLTLVAVGIYYLWQKKKKASTS